MEYTAKECNHCGAKEGYRRPVGRYIVELHRLEVQDQKLDLCITCYKHYKRKEAKALIETQEKPPSFYSNFVKFYKETFHLELKDH